MSKTFSHDPKFNLNLAIKPNRKPGLRDDKSFLLGLDFIKMTTNIQKKNDNLKVKLKISDDNLKETLKKHNTLVVEQHKSNLDKFFSKKKTLDSRNTYYTTNDVRKFNRFHSTSEKSLISLIPLNKKKMLVGFKNLGNTCYMNTILQILIHIDFFRDSFISETKHFDLSNKHLTKAFLEILQLYINTDNNVINPSLFMEIFKNTHSKFNNYFHQDSQEFLRVLLDDLSNQLNRIGLIPSYKEIQLSKNYSKCDLNEEYYRIFQRRENSIIVDLFNTQIINSFTCTSCDYKTYSIEKIIDIPLVINSKYSSKCSCIDLLEDYFEEEIIEWDNICINCNKRVKYKKIVRLSKLSKILIITFQRYNYQTNNKNLININIKENLDISKYLDKDCINDEEVTYKLVGISNHAGKLNFGHYYAYCKLGTKWYEFNDEKVTRLSSFELNSSNVYSLFYTMN